MLKEQLEKRRKQIEKRVEQDRVERMVKVFFLLSLPTVKLLISGAKTVLIYFILFFSILYYFIYFYFILAKMET